MGNLELNAFMPLIADSLLGSLDLLTNACVILNEKCVVGLSADRERCREQVHNSTAAITALIERIGYENAQKILEYSRENNVSLRQAAAVRGDVTETEFDELVAPEAVMRLGSADKC